VRIDNPAVSGHHSLIINILNDSFLEDLNSTNGTYVNGKLIKKHALQHGDVITIGHHQLRFADQHTANVEQDEFEKTMVIPTDQQDAGQLAKAELAADAAASAEPAPAAEAPPAVAHAERIDVRVEMPEDEPELAPAPPPPVAAPAPVVAPVAPPPAPAPVTPMAAARAEPAAHSATAVGIDPKEAPVALPLAKLQVLSGAFAGRDLELTKALTTLGRPGVQVAAITRRAEGYFVVHVESGEEGDYPLVNGQPIGAQARKLADNDVLQLAGVKMGFFAS
jgi:predicted component of type VI protein secretion system